MIRLSFHFILHFRTKAQLEETVSSKKKTKKLVGSLLKLSVEQVWTHKSTAEVT